jgi:hypothetical protein
MLPAVRSTGHKRGAHEKDAYETLPGSVPGRASNERIVKQTPIQRDLTEAERAQQLVLRNEAQALGDRYNAWLDALIAAGGDKILALAQVFGIEDMAEVRIRQYELETEVRRGQGASEVGELLEKNDLGLAAQLRVLRQWTYSPNAAASINALKIVGELAGEQREQGSFEQFLRLSKLQTGKA